MLAPLVLAALLAAGGCRRAAEPDAGVADRIRVFVGIPPQAFFVERIGGPRVAVEVLVAPGQSPHTYEPTPQQIARLVSSRLYFSTGMEFEDVLAGRLAGGGSTLEVVDTRAGIPLRAADGESPAQAPPAGHDAHDHEHDPHEDNAGDSAHAHHAHAPGAPDPHVWLSPPLVRIQARTIAAALARVDPAGADEYAERLRAFDLELAALDAHVRDALAPCRGRTLFVFHASYGYFADAYGLTQIAVEVAGKEPTPRQLAALVERARTSGARAIFVEPQYPSATAHALAREIGCPVVELDPLARDYLENMRAMTRRVAEALRP